MDPHGYTSAFSRGGHLLLMRHPQTEANEQHHYLGQHNAPLTELGRRQCERAVAGLIAWEPDRIVTSPLDRCRAIAVPAAESLGCPLTVDERVVELEFGIIENMTGPQIEEADLPLPWGERADEWPVEGAESMDEFRGRLAAAGDDLIALSGKTAVVAHGGAIRALIATWFDIPVQKMWQIALANVNSALMSVEDNRYVYLERLGLEPEQLGCFK